MKPASRTIHLIAPSGYCHNQSAAALGIERLQQAGHQIINADILQRRFQRFAGNDAERLQDINYFAQSQPDALPDIVLAIRGGYGATRLLERIDYAGLHKKLTGQALAICGHSDFTALQLALLAQSRLITFSGPMLSSNFGADPLSIFTLQHFWQAVTSPVFTLEWSGDSTEHKELEGILWGGNLSMIQALTGTPWMPDINGGILVIEDVNEHPYRIERMLLQLYHSGILAKQRAVIIGSFTGAVLTEYDNGFNFAGIWQKVREMTGLPVITGLAFGHDHDTVTLPIGARGRLSTANGYTKLTISGHPVLCQ